MIDPVLPVRPFPASGGECAAILDRIDWTDHPLGEPAGWPVELKTAVRICLTSRFASMVHWGPRLHTFYNDVYAERLGRKHPGHLGQPAYDWWSEMWDQLEPFFQKVQAGNSYYTENARYTPDRDGAVKEAFFTHSHSPIWDDAGTVRGIFLTVVETTAQVQAEARNHLLLAELQHRIKNTLAVVQAIVTQSIRRANSKDEIGTIVRAQIAALGRAHDLLTRSVHDRASLADVVRNCLDSHGPYAGRIVATGPEVILNPKAVTSFMMILHELVTNAMKHGALSNGTGRVTATWRVSGDTLVFEWEETGGPVVAPPTREGFGTRLMGGMSAEVGGHATFDYPPNGLIFTLRSDMDTIRAE